MLSSRGPTAKALREALDQELEPWLVPVPDKKYTLWLAGCFCQQRPCEPPQKKEGRPSISYAWVWGCSTSTSQDQNISFLFAGYNPFFQEKLIVTVLLGIQAIVFRTSSLRTDKIVTVSSPI